MFKRMVGILLVLALLLALLVSCVTGGEESTSSTADQGGDVVPKTQPMGDANGDGTTDEADLLLFKSYLAGEATEMHYEFCDLNGDFAVDSADAELLERYLAGESVEINGTVFGREDEDITDKLEDLGVNNYKKWGNSDIKYIISRNPYDMISSNGVVMVSGGNYQDNTGPVIIYGYTKGSDEPIEMGTLSTEQVNRFYDFGNYIATLSIDSRNSWHSGADVYVKYDTGNKWMTQSRVLLDNIHCYDMICYKGNYFYCGSNVGYATVDGDQIELSKVVIYKAEVLRSAMSSYNYEEVDVVNKHGDVIDYKTCISVFEYNGEKIYDTKGVPRFYEFFEFQGKLYAFYYNQYSERYDEASDFNGLYVYDEESDAFVYDGTLDIEGLIPVFSGTYQDGEKIQHDFEWGDRYYFINAGLYSTGDFITYTKEKISGYEDYLVRDVIFRGDKAYVLASCELDDGTFTNVVLETADFESFRTLFHFDSELFARSFEFCNGEFYFGLGYSIGLNLDPESIKNCGQIYRYSYYN